MRSRAVTAKAVRGLTTPPHSQFSAEIPCYRELTGNFHFFARRFGVKSALEAAKFGRFRSNSLFPGTGNFES
jgi:hypothetical protein